MTSPILIAATAASMAVFASPAADRLQDVLTVASDCSDAARQVVADTGGELLSAQPRNGVCVVTVLVPGKGNARPRKVTVRVPIQ
ncbi:hypothetical protein SAMN05892877_106331 [Rhizobium subbaraonis]|uniref:YpeB-like protein with protease inhibitory function n=1 Tax=Rhizobium subbaraonis TaxID=908946 RepID=A0A285UE30_9HYPH|nr:hypothetical protein [Rhizobium subbaraonis]SOC40013.1 hypothetical protein SAMN05892877_106331 [Rhizobium subbaraonis]